LGGEEVYLLLIIDLGTRRGKWSESRPGRALATGKDLRYPLDRRLGGPRAGLDAEVRGKILLPLLGIEPR
jgi:hypothetical protein